MEDSNRISLRLDQHELKMIDDFLNRHPEFGSRSHLARSAIRKMVSEGEEGEEQRTQGMRPKVYRVMLSPLEAQVISRMVNMGYYLDEADAIRRLVANAIIDPSEVSKAVGSIHDERRQLVRMDEEK
ncbi:MAG: ribbon-helix-helix domain-containing protein [Methanomassiliicoccales archaeon]